MVKRPPHSAGDAGSIPAQEAEAPRASGQLSLQTASTEPACYAAPASTRVCAMQMKILKDIAKTQHGQIKT